MTLVQFLDLWHWENEEGTKVSPGFYSRQEAEEWYDSNQ